MEYAGRATSIKFEKKLNGTHTLTFSMPDKWYDSKLGDYVYNEFIDQMYNERKVKFFYKNKWYEFYIKSISEAKNFMKSFTIMLRKSVHLQKKFQKIPFGTMHRKTTGEILQSSQKKSYLKFQLVSLSLFMVIS